MDRDLYPEDREQDFCFHLAQYPFFMASYLADPTALHWVISKEADQDRHLTFRGHRRFATFLRGYENDDLVLEIKIPEDEPRSLPETSQPNHTKQKVARKSALEYELHQLYFSDQQIKIQVVLPPSKCLWQSNMLHIEKLSTLQIMEYGAIAAIKKQRACSMAQLEELISNDAHEEAFQQLLKKNWWIFGNEYGEIIGQREIAPGTQQDFLAKRTADGFLEIIEIKRPLNGKSLIYKTNQGSHARSHYRQELSDAIAQVIDYIDEIENDKHSLYYKEKNRNRKN